MDRNNFIDNKMLRKSLISMTVASICSTLPELMLPIVAGNLVSAESIAAMNLCRPVLEGYMLLAILLSSGALSLTAREIGKGYIEKASKHYSSSIYSIFIVQMLYAFTVFLLRDPISVMLSDGHGELSELCRDYLGIASLNALPYSIATMLSMFAAMEGQPQKAAMANAVGLICISISFLIPGEKTITSIASALIIYNVACIAALMPYLFSDQFSLRIVRPGKHLMRDTRENMKLGMHHLIEHIIKIVCVVILNSLVQRSAGTEGSIIWGLVCALMVLCELIQVNLDQVMTSLGSVLRGEHDMRGFRSLVDKIGKILLCCVTTLFVLSFIFPGTVMNIFGISPQSDMNSEFRMALPMLFVCSVFINGCSMYFKIGDYHTSLLTSVIYNGVPVLCLGIAYLIMPDHIWAAFLPAFALCTAVYVFYSRKFELRMDRITKDIVSLETSIPYDMSQIGSELNEIREFGKKTGIPADVMDKVEHCIDELSYNIIKHCPDKLADKYYNLRMIVREHELEVFFKDAGRPFNPVIEYSDRAIDAESEGKKMMLALRLFNYYASEPQYRYMAGINFTRMRYKY